MDHGPQAHARTGALSTAASVAFLAFVSALPWSIAAMSIGLGACAALTALVWLVERRPWRAPLPLLWPALGWLLALVLATFTAWEPLASWPRVAKGALPVLVWMAAYHAGGRREGGRAIALLLASATLVALVGLGMWATKGAAFPERARGAAGHYMTFAGQLLLWVSMASGIALATRGRWRLASGSAALIGLAALAATFTRSAWIGVFVSLAVMLLLVRPRGLLALVLAGVVIVAVAPEAFRNRLFSAVDPAHASNVERTHMWQAGLAMFRDHPLTGVGLQDMHAAYERYKPATAREPAGHLHNVFIQIAASMGIVGLAAFFWLYGSLARLAAGPPPLRAGGLGAGVRLGVLGALAGFLVAGLFEWNFGDEELLDLLYTLVGLAWAARGWSEDQPRAIASAEPPEGDR
jgi:putative inorganic carbon (HCO3(-)) transporter